MNTINEFLIQNQQYILNESFKDFSIDKAKQMGERNIKIIKKILIGYGIDYKQIERESKKIALSIKGDVNKILKNKNESPQIVAQKLINKIGKEAISLIHNTTLDKVKGLTKDIIKSIILLVGVLILNTVLMMMITLLLVLFLDHLHLNLVLH